MRTFKLVATAIGGILLAAPAWAGYVEATYSGTVAQVSAAGAAAGLAIGMPINFDVVFDPSTLVDYTAVVNGANRLTGANAFTSVLDASLSDDPLASLSITVGSITFNKFDARSYGTQGGLGVSNLPYVEYVNGSFAGTGNIFVNSQGYTLDADPVADYLIRLLTNGQDEFGLGGPRTGDFDFYLGQGTTSSPFGTGLAVGNVDAADATIRAVPEPASRTLLLASLGMTAGLLRAARRR